MDEKKIVLKTFLFIIVKFKKKKCRPRSSSRLTSTFHLQRWLDGESFSETPSSSPACDGRFKLLPFHECCFGVTKTNWAFDGSCSTSDDIKPSRSSVAVTAATARLSWVVESHVAFFFFFSSLSSAAIDE